METNDKTMVTKEKLRYLRRKQVYQRKNDGN